MKTTANRLPAALALLTLLTLLPSCGSKKVILPPAYKSRVSPAVPATQRPYRINGKTYYPLPSCEGYEENGIASWYGDKFHGRKTSNGETYDMHGPTAAHKILPMNTMVLVRNLENDREAVVRINDRGPFVKGRIIDLSMGAAKELDMLKKGTARVRVTALGETRLVRQDGRLEERFLPHRDFQTGDFLVQIGSFLEQKNAVRLRDRMAGWGRTAVIRTFRHQGKTYYRVQVQAGRDLARARHLEKALGEAGFPDAFVIAR